MGPGARAGDAAAVEVLEEVRDALAGTSDYRRFAGRQYGTLSAAAEPYDSWQGLDPVRQCGYIASHPPGVPGQTNAEAWRELL